MKPTNPFDECCPNPTLGPHAEAPLVRADGSNTTLPAIVDEALLLDMYRLVRSVLLRNELRPLEQVFLRSGAEIFQRLAQICADLAPPDDDVVGRHKLFVSRTSSLAASKPVDLASEELDAVSAQETGETKTAETDATATQRRSRRRSTGDPGKSSTEG